MSVVRHWITPGHRGIRPHRATPSCPCRPVQVVGLDTPGAVAYVHGVAAMRSAGEHTDSSRAIVSVPSLPGPATSRTAHPATALTLRAVVGIAARESERRSRDDIASRGDLEKFRGVEAPQSRATENREIGFCAMEVARFD